METSTLLIADLDECEGTDGETPQSAGDVFLTGKATRSEIVLKDLSPEDRRKYDASMEKEWASWQKFDAVENLTPQQIEQLPEDAQVVGPSHDCPRRRPKAPDLHGS